jgi:methylenetetrahydrofolate dehydrogenase (NADP+)/methenyltetrahydrofolate cyclohydrolase
MDLPEGNLMVQILDGNSIAATIRSEIKEKIVDRSGTRTPPCLAVLLCSEDPASEIYVRKKQEACAEVGINSFLIKPFSGGIENWLSPMGHLLSTIKWLNEDASVDGILVQLPLPKQLSPQLVFDTINPLKDVDVFSPENVGLLLQGRPRFVPCTPQGIQELLIRSGVEIAGKQVAIINRSDIVGKPLSALLIQDQIEANATVVTCHDRTPPERLKQVCLSSDIIVVAVGKPGFLTADLVPEGAVVVDVGINRIGKKIVGDVDFASVSPKCSWISPVPGGVGPMTVTMLLRNTLLAQRYK